MNNPFGEGCFCPLEWVYFYVMKKMIKNTDYNFEVFYDSEESLKLQQNPSDVLFYNGDEITPLILLLPTLTDIYQDERGKIIIECDGSLSQYVLDNGA